MRAIASVLLFSTLLLGQGRTGGGTASRPPAGGAVAVPGPGGHPGTSGMLYETNELLFHGRVALPDGSTPQQLVTVERACKGVTQSGGFADSKGRFSFNLGALNRALLGGGGGIVDTESTNKLAANTFTPDDLKGCEIRATLAGYGSQSVALGPGTVLQNGDLGTLTLKPLGDGAGTRSTSDAEVPKGARKAFEKGVDAAARAKWAEAIDALQKATQQYSEFSSAWLGLGMLHEGSGNLQAAFASYREAVKADPKFAAPYLHSAVVSAALSQWQDVVQDTSKAIELAPKAYPRAYLLNAVANIRLRNAAAAEKSALEGLRIDDEHRYPDLEYILGIALVAKNDRAAAIGHFEKYLAAAPKGPSAASARQQLTALQSAR